MLINDPTVPVATKDDLVAGNRMLLQTPTGTKQLDAETLKEATAENGRNPCAMGYVDSNADAVAAFGADTDVADAQPNTMWNVLASVVVGLPNDSAAAGTLVTLYGNVSSTSTLQIYFASQGNIWYRIRWGSSPTWTTWKKSSYFGDIHLLTAVTAFSSGDSFVIDNGTDGPRSMLFSTLIKLISDEILNNFASSGELTKSVNNYWTRDYAHMKKNGGSTMCTLSDFKNRKAVCRITNSTKSFKWLAFLDSSWNIFKTYPIEDNKEIVVEFDSSDVYYFRVFGSSTDDSALEITIDFLPYEINRVELERGKDDAKWDSQYYLCRQMYWDCNTLSGNFGKIFSHVNFDCVPFLIKVGKGDYFYYTGKIASGGNAECWAIFDDCGELVAKAPLKDNLYTNQKFVIPCDGYLAVDSLHNVTPYFALYRNSKFEKDTYHYQITTSKKIDSSGAIVVAGDDKYCVTSIVGIRTDMDLMLYEVFAETTSDCILNFYDKENTKLSSICTGVAGVQDYVVTKSDIPARTAYVVISVNDDEKYCPQFMQCSAEYVSKWQSTSLNSKKKVALLGSSWSVIKQSRFGKRIWREEMLCDIDTYGRGGAGYIVQGAFNNSCVQYQADAVISSGKSYDSIFIWSTSNDMYQSIPIGDVTDFTTHDSYDADKHEVVTYDSEGHQTPSTYDSTFCGGINYTLKTLGEGLTGARIYVFGLCKNFAKGYGYDKNATPNAVGLHYTDYNDAIKECADNYGCVFIPVGDVAGVSVNNKSKYFVGDNQHLSRYGYVKICKALTNYLKTR